MEESKRRAKKLNAEIVCSLCRAKKHFTTTLTYYSFDRNRKEEQAMAINDALKLD